MEKSYSSGEWTYEQAKQAAIKSLKGIGVNPTSELDSYYHIPETIRAGEHASWPKFTKKTHHGIKDETGGYGPVKEKPKKPKYNPY